MARAVSWSKGYETVEPVSSMREALEIQRFLLVQGRSVLQGVRILLPSPGKPTIRVQAIWTDDSAWKGQVGMCRVIIPPGFLRSFMEPAE